MVVKGRPYKITKKDNNLFFIGLFGGSAGGLFGSLFVTSWFKLMENFINQNLSLKIFLSVISSIVLLWYFWFIYKHVILE